MGADALGKAIEIFPSITGASADSGYRKTTVNDAKTRYGIKVDVVEKGEVGWKVLPKRWIVERSISWISHSRRLVCIHEKTNRSSENFVYIAMSAILLKRNNP